MFGALWRHKRLVTNKMWTIISILFISVHLSTSKCTFDDGKYDLSPLDRSSQWLLRVINKNKPVMYHFNFCRPLTMGENCKNATICSQDDSGETCIIASNSEPVFSKSVNNEGFWLMYNGSSCSGKENSNKKSAINFQCADKLGSPIFLYESLSTTYFVWPTSAACEKKLKSSRLEVPCYVYDGLGRKLDLSELNKKSGYHKVNTALRPVEFLINVCGDIVDQDLQKDCPQSGACRKIGSELINFGRSVEPLKIDGDGNLILEYIVNETNPKIPAKCTEPPKTTVTFKCPHSVGVSYSFAQSMGPFLTMASNCHYQIQWTTEYACPLKELESTDSCALNQREHGVDLDLLPLRKHDDPYHVPAESKDFYLNICGGLPETVCQDGETSVCMKSGSQEVSLGSSKSTDLRYSDGQLILTYASGSQCEQNENYTTIINFECSHNETDQLTFNQHIGCTYFFNFETSHACVDLAIGTECRASRGSALVDLSSLIKHEDNYGWTAVTSSVKEYAKADIILNVCGSVFIPTNFSGCSLGSAVCLKEESGKVVSLGRYEEEPRFTGVITELFYPSGEDCRQTGKKYSSLIKFFCLRGEINSGPTLTSVSNDKCEFEFEWPTAAACVQVKNYGKNCKVYNEDLGLEFDLSPLRENGTFKVNNSDYDFYISVCGAAKEPLCDSLGKYAICQVKKDNNSEIYSLGQPNSYLSYYDGFVNLTYTGGTPYRNKTPRQTSISFLCDSTAGNGYPEFVEEVNQIYNFKWYTSLVCSNEPTECVFVDESKHVQYDLSSLTRLPNQTNWEFIQKIREETLVFYINICRPLIKGVSGCDNGASVCIKKLSNGVEENYVSNAGRARSGQVQEISERSVSLDYDKGDVCLNSSMRETYTTSIHFMCDTKEDMTKIVALRLNRCHFVIIWPTRAACFQEIVTSKDACTIKDPLSNAVFDLQPLRDVYNVHMNPQSQSDFTSITISICGAQIKNVCNNSQKVAACAVGSENQVLGSYNSAQLEIPQMDKILVKYFGGYDTTTGKPKSEVQIELKCKPDTERGDMNFVDHFDDTYYFEMETSIACSNKDISCVTWDEKGNKYDLTSLIRDESNWNVQDSRDNHKDLSYVINVCRPLVPFVSQVRSNCSAERAAACQKSNTGRSFSLGRVTQPPQIISGQVVLRYEGGTPCHQGQFNRSTRITFECSKVQSDPVFVDETPECEYIISWSTPAACPEQHLIGQNCYVDDPQFDYRYDLSPLRDLGTQTVLGNGHMYNISVCAGITCGDASNVGVCQEAGDRYIVGGVVNDNVQLKDEELSLEYIGGKGNCHGKYNRSAQIRFICGTSNPGKPVFIEEWENCSYIFVWETTYACAPSTTSQCSVYDDQGRLYDLSELTLYNSSHEVLGENGKIKYLINVCRAVPQTDDVKCPSTSGVCQIDVDEKDHKKKFTNLGSVHLGPYFEDNTLKLKYTYGDCGSNKAEVVISFKCDRSKLVSEPEFLLEDNCTWHFVWSTAFACPVSREEDSENDCTVTNPRSGFEYDLKPLSNSSGYTFEDEHKQHRYTINVCGNIAKSSCGPDIGGCQEEITGSRKWSLGIANSNLHYHDGVIFLNYTGGHSCHGGKYQRSTFIRFVCSRGSGVGKPIFMEESEDCTYHVKWYTDYVCENRVHCSVNNADGSLIDLYPLAAHAYNIALGRNRDETLLVRICQPFDVISKYPNCPAGSASCKVDKTGNAISLGQVRNPPLVDEDGRIVLSYTDGSPCPSDVRQRISTEIILICSTNHGLGFPTHMDTGDECNYVFEWFTQFACPMEKQQLLTKSAPCVFNDPETNVTYDLKPLSGKNGDVIKVNGQEDAFVNICGEISDPEACKDAAICQDSKVSFGSLETVKAYANKNDLKMTFEMGSQCEDKGVVKNWSSEIIFSCDWSAKLGRPMKIESISCHAYYEWKTSLVCSQSCVVVGKNSALIDLRPLAALSHTWNASDGDGNKYWINVCHELPKSLVVSDLGFFDATVIVMSPAGISDVLGVLSDRQLVFNDSTDEVVLTYRGFTTKACKNEVLPKVDIHFVCDNGLGNPKFIEKNEDSCEYSFEWRTWAACAEKKIEQKMDWTTGTVRDEDIQMTMDFSGILNKMFNVTENMNRERYVYVISLAQDSKDACGFRGICQTKTSFQRVIGLVDDAKMYRFGEQLRMEFPSNSVCGRLKNRHVSSIITFECDLENGIGEPQFTFESQDCQYNFNWKTNAVCFEKMTPAITLSNISDSGGLSAGAIFAIVGFVLGISIIIIVVFSSKSRRHAFASRCRQLWQQARQNPAYRYTRHR